MTKVVKTVNGKALGDCPKCKSENSRYLNKHLLKWGRISRWQYVQVCMACDYESEAK